MQKYSIPRHIWRAIYPFLIYLVVSVGIALAVSVGFILSELTVEAAINLDTLDQDAILERAEAFIDEYGMLMTLIASIGVTIVFSLMWRKIRTRIQRFDRSKFNPLLLLITVLVCAGANYILVFIVGITDILRYFPDYEEVAQMLSGGDLIVRVLAIGVVAPIVEEILCRGIVFNRLNSWMPTWVAVVVSSALFGLIHMNLFQAIYAFIVGLGFCMLYVRYRSLWIPIIGHMAFNMANLALNEILTALGAEEINALFIIIPSVLATAGGIAYMIRFTKGAVPVRDRAEAEA